MGDPRREVLLAQKRAYRLAHPFQPDGRKAVVLIVGCQRSGTTLMLELFGAEMTAVPGTCGNCGAREPMAQTDVYLDAPGVVMRCRHCDAVLMRIVRGPDRAWVNLSGLAAIELRLE